MTMIGNYPVATYFDSTAKSLIAYAQIDDEFARWLSEAIPFFWVEQTQPTSPEVLELRSAEVISTPHRTAATVRARWLIGLINEGHAEAELAKCIFADWRREHPEPLSSLVFGPWLAFGWPAVIAGRIAYHEEVSMVVIVRSEALHSPPLKMSQLLVKVCGEALSQEIARPHSPEVDSWLHGERALELFEASDVFTVNDIREQLCDAGIVFGALDDTLGDTSLLAVTPAYDKTFSALTDGLLRLN